MFSFTLLVNQATKGRDTLNPEFTAALPGRNIPGGIVTVTP